MKQYKTQYGTIFAVKEHSGAPAVMCRAELSETWSLSSMIEPFTPGAWTAEELQGQLDSWAATKGWQPVEEPASVEPPETADEGGELEDGFPDWVRPMVEAFLQFDFVRELPAFTAFALRHSEPVQHRQGGSLADGLYYTVSKGIKFSVFRGDNSDQYREAHYTWADFVRRCKAAGLAPEQLHQDKEDAPCNTKTPAPTGAAAATTDASAAPVQLTAAETSTTLASGEAANNSPGLPSAPADTSAQSPKAADTVPATRTTAAPASGNGLLPAFDYNGLPADTAEHLQNLARRAAQAKQRYILDMMEIVVEAHSELVAPCDKHNNQHSEATFRAWCASIGVGKDTAYRLLQVQALMDGSTPEEQEVLADAPAKLLYAAAKPSAPAELVQAVKDGDITTNKQYRDLLARYNAEKAARQQAEQERDEAATHIQAARDMQIDTARERDTALRRAAEAEKQRDGAQKLAEQRGNENTELKARIRDMENQPRDVAVVQPGEDQIEAWRKEGETRAAAALQAGIRQANQAKADALLQVSDLQIQLAAARPDADACQRTADTLYETTENLRLLLRTQLKQARLPPATYGSVVAHVLQAADALRDTVRSCAPAGYTFDNEEDDDFE